MKITIFFMVITLLMSTAVLSAAELSDADAKKLLEKLWNPAAVYIKLGSLDISRIELDQAGNLISPESQTLKAYAKTGIITVQEDQCLQHYQAYLKTQDQNKIIQVQNVCYQSGFKAGVSIVGKITAQKTSKGEELAQKSGLPQQQGLLVINQGVFQVDKIVKNEAQKKGVDEYHVVMSTYKAQWTPEFKQAMAILGNSLSEDRKAINLLKFDPFKSEWVLIAEDDANKDAEFKTNNVSKKLSE